VLILSGPITYGQGVVLGLLQGFAELFPISSLGQSVVAPRVLGWNIHQSDNYYIAFLVATHLATAIVLLGFFWRDWVRIVTGMWRSLQEREITTANPDGRLGWLLVVATIPAGILGLLLQDKLQSVFASSRSAAFFLILNGVMLYGAELLRRRAPGEPEGEADGDHRIAERTSWRQSVAVGTAQALALIPGFSRSGTTMGGGLLVGLSNQDSARFAFLLATPIIGAAAVLKIPVLLGPDGNGVRGPAVLASLCSALTAYLSIRFLMKYFETNRLTPFAVFCFVEGIVLSTWWALS
jgi:undecaprenyl-diphosphatase